MVAPQVFGPAGFSEGVGPLAHAYPGGAAASRRVRCLECGAVYRTPVGGGTVASNPGCPGCGYIGWADVTDPVTGMPPLRSSADPLRPPPDLRR